MALQWGFILVIGAAKRKTAFCRNFILLMDFSFYMVSYKASKSGSAV
jgi:hypothetical protein